MWWSLFISCRSKAAHQCPEHNICWSSQQGQPQNELDYTRLHLQNREQRCGGSHKSFNKACVVLSGGTGVYFIFTHTQSHIMGKRLALTLRHWPWQRKRAHFSSFIFLLSSSLSWSSPHLCSRSLPPHLSVVFLILLKHKHTDSAVPGCIYSLHCILHRCVNMWCAFTPLHYEACFHEHPKMKNDEHKQ